jgi:hypothetical protein
MKCPNCGESAPEGASFCPDCGKAMAEKSAGRLSRFFRGLSDIVNMQDVEAETTARLQLERGTGGERVRFTKSVPIAKVDVAKRLIYGVVYEPGIADAHDDGMTPEEIEKACHSFAENYAKAQAESGGEHAVDFTREEVTVVENYIAPSAFRLGEQAVSKGSWVMVTKAHSDEIWAAVQDGTFTGYSFEGWGRRVAA